MRERYASIKSVTSSEMISGDTISTPTRMIWSRIDSTASNAELANTGVNAVTGHNW